MCFSAQVCCWLAIPSAVLALGQPVEISKIIDLSDSFHLLADHSINLYYNVFLYCICSEQCAVNVKYTPTLFAGLLVITILLQD